MFYGRESEIASLEKLHKKTSFQMLVMYGRRRIGKTSILNEFVKDKNHLYLPAEEVNDGLNLKKFSSLLGEKLGIKAMSSVDNWNSFFEMIIENFSDEKLVLVIDEYPYAATANKSLNSILQHLIDYKFQKTNIFLILCGSSISFMENEVLGEKSPLFGRRSGQIKVGPLDYYDASRFYEHESANNKIKYYSAFGGTPYYLSLIDRALSFEENLRDLYFDISSYLLNEGVLLMKQEFREASNYNSILQAIASGANTVNEISGFSHLPSSTVSKYLSVLQDLDYVSRQVSFGDNPLKSKKSKYHIKENFLSFWYKFIFAQRYEIERGNSDAYFNHTLEKLDEFTSYKFEDLVMQYFRRMNKDGKLAFLAKNFARWWGKDKNGNPQEIDLIVESMNSKELILVECKWRDNFNVNKTLIKLGERAENFKEYACIKYLVSKDKIDPSVKRKEIIYLSSQDLYL